MRKDKLIGYIISEQASNPCKPTIITESSDCGIDTITIGAELQDCAELNRNKRRYPKQILSSGLNRENIQELIMRKSWVGEAGHPEQPTLQRQMRLEQKNISHRINSYSWAGSKLNGVVQSWVTPRGAEFRDSVRMGMELAFSLRALGPIKKQDGVTLVCDPLTVITYDWVYIPSHRKSYQTAIIPDVKANPTLQESYCIPLLEESAIDFIKEESQNFKLISSYMDLCPDEILLSEDFRTVAIKDSERSGDTIVVGIENYINRDISAYFNKFR